MMAYQGRVAASSSNGISQNEDFIFNLGCPVFRGVRKTDIAQRTNLSSWFAAVHSLDCLCLRDHNDSKQKKRESRRKTQ
jgi:hypothetical protein